MNKTILTVLAVCLSIGLSGCLGVGAPTHIDCGVIYPNDTPESISGKMHCFQTAFSDCSLASLGIQISTPLIVWQTNYDISWTEFDEENNCVIQQQFTVLDTIDESLRDLVHQKTLSCTYSKGLSFNDFIYEKMPDREYIENNCTGNAKEGLLFIFDFIS
jgi:hypothetical protein